VKVTVVTTRPLCVTMTDGFGFNHGVTSLTTSKSTSKPNFDEIYQSAAKILLLPVSEYKWQGILLPVSIDHFIVVGMPFCIGLPKFIRIGTSVAEL